MSRYNLRLRPSTGPFTDISCAPVNPAQLTDVSPSSLFSASPGHPVTEAPHLETEPSDVHVVGLGETNLKSGDDVNADNPFVEKRMYSTNWATPGSRHSCSLDTPKRTSELNVNQIKVVKLACENLTRKQKDLISKHEDHVCKKTHSHRPGTSKGKGVDPRNWGGVAISDTDLDIEAQASMLENFKTNHENEQCTSAQIISPDEDTVVKNPDEDLVKSADESSVSNDKKKKKRKKRTKKSKKAYKYRSASAPLSREYEKEISKAAGGHQEKPTKVEYIPRRDVKQHAHNFKPSAQINPKSYLGAAFKEAQEFKTQARKSDGTYGNLDSSSEDSDSESSDSSYYSDTSDDSNTDPLSDSDISTSDPNSSDSSSESSSDSDASDDSYKHKKQKNNKKSKKYRKHKGKKHTKKSLLKPIPPDKYDRAPETQLFHKFMTQLMAYLEDGNVPKPRHVYILSNFLTDKAYTFYTRNVSRDPKRWTAA
jgi:hypothetical protein